MAIDRQRAATGAFSLLRGAYGAYRRRALSLRRLPIVRQLRGVLLRRMRPLDNGRQRGTPIVRHYWRLFLERHRADIRGHALEIGTTRTIRQYGGAALLQVDAIDLTAHAPDVTVVADLASADDVPSDTYDCFLNQFTMHVIFDVESALYHSIRILKPSGVLLVNFSCVDYYFPGGLDMGTGKPMFMFWWFTPIQVENLLRSTGLATADYEIEVNGNLFVRLAYQLNMAAEELTPDELEHVDAGYPLLISVRVVKPHGWYARKPQLKEPWLPDTAPAHWNPVTGHYPA